MAIKLLTTSLALLALGTRRTLHLSKSAALLRALPVPAAGPPYCPTTSPHRRLRGAASAHLLRAELKQSGETQLPASPGGHSRTKWTVTRATTGSGLGPHWRNEPMQPLHSQVSPTQHSALPGGLLRVQRTGLLGADRALNVSFGMRGEPLGTGKRAAPGSSADQTSEWPTATAHSSRPAPGEVACALSLALGAQQPAGLGGCATSVVVPPVRGTAARSPGPTGLDRWSGSGRSVVRRSRDWYGVTRGRRVVIAASLWRRKSTEEHVLASATGRL